MFKLLKKIWRKLWWFIYKKPLTVEKILSEEKVKLSESEDTEVLLNHIRETENEDVQLKLVSKLASVNTAKGIIDFIENELPTNSVIKKVNGLYDLRSELLKLEEKKLLLEIATSKIGVVIPPNITHINKGFENLFKKDDNFKESNNYIIENSFLGFEKIFNENLTVIKYRNRERENEILYLKQIKKSLSEVENLIGQNKLDEAKDLLKLVSKSIKPNYKNEVKKYKQLIDKLKEKEIKRLLKNKEEALRKHREEVLKIKKAEEAKYEQKKQLTEIEIKKKRQLESAVQIKKEKLNSLLQKKHNWLDYQEILQKNNIQILYHFTDLANVSSIKKNGGLYSWHYMDVNNIDIPFPGGSPLSRTLDKQYGLEDYVRVSFTKNHPMMHVAIGDGRIRHPIILNIDVSVCYFEKTKFANMNAARNGHSCGSNVEDLQAIKFHLVKLKDQFNINQEERPYYQAEVLIKTWIPINFITNIDKINT